MGHQTQNMGNDHFVGLELGVVDPIQEFLENGVEDLDGRRDGNNLWLSFLVAHERPVVYGSLRFALQRGVFFGPGS